MTKHIKAKLKQTKHSLTNLKQTSGDVKIAQTSKYGSLPLFVYLWTSLTRYAKGALAGIMN